MEGLRGFAVLLVFLVHYVGLVQPWLSEASFAATLAIWISRIGNIGVDLFFVLSGFLIYGALIARKRPFPGYFQRRIQRIYPTFIAVFAIYVALSLSIPSVSKIPAGTEAGAWYLLRNFLLIPGIMREEAMITVAWSLSFEMFFYLATPALIGSFGLRRWRPSRRIALFLLLTIVFALNYQLFGERIRLIVFLSGMILYECLTHKLTRVPGSALTLILLTAGLGVMLMRPFPIGGFAGQLCILFAAFLSLCLTCFARPDSVVARFFSGTPLRWLGNISYSYYLIHGLALQVAFLALAMMLPPSRDGQAIFFLLLPPMFALTLAPSSALFLLIERPLSIHPQVKPAKSSQVQVRLST